MLLSSRVARVERGLTSFLLLHYRRFHRRSRSWGWWQCVFAHQLLSHTQAHQVSIRSNVEAK